jgi:hypothetical protein
MFPPVYYFSKDRLEQTGEQGQRPDEHNHSAKGEAKGQGDRRNLSKDLIDNSHYFPPRTEQRT